MDNSKRREAVDEFWARLTHGVRLARRFTRLEFLEGRLDS